MRAIPLHPLLAEELDAWNLFVNPTNSESWVFPGRHPGEHLTRRFLTMRFGRLSMNFGAGNFNSLLQTKLFDQLQSKRCAASEYPINL